MSTCRHQNNMKHHSFETGHSRKVGEISYCNHRPEHTFFFVDAHERIWYYHNQSGLRYYGREEPANSYCFDDSTALEFIIFTGKDFYRVFDNASNDTEYEQKDIRECQEVEGKLRKIPHYYSDNGLIQGIHNWIFIVNGVYYNGIAYDCPARGEWQRTTKRDIEESALQSLWFAQYLNPEDGLNEGDISLERAILDTSPIEFLVVMGVTLEASLKKSGIDMALSSSG